jgi:selenium-binding protein 1
MKAPREKLLYTTALYVGTAIEKPDYLATIDVDPESSTCGQVIHRLPMPNLGDELHHFGWNACSSCHADPHQQRKYLIVPGQRSGRIHIVDMSDARAPQMFKVIEPAAIQEKTNLSAPHTVHCLPGGQVMISMLGDGEGKAPGGFLLLDGNFEIVGRWGAPETPVRFNYDYWYQPRQNVMVSSEWAAPTTYSAGFDLADVKNGLYGDRLYFWDFKEQKIVQTIELGETGMIPLEVRFHHNPESAHGFVGAALSSTMWHWWQRDNKWEVEKVIEVEGVDLEGWPMKVPGLITDLLISMDDRYLYFSNWLHGDIRQYDISDPAHPKLTGQVWCGGLLGKAPTVKGKKLVGGPQMLQLSLDGKRLYVTSSLFSSWDNQFYPDIAKAGSFLVQLDCDTEKGGMTLNENFLVDFGAEPDGPARAHEMRYPGGDCTSDIFV